ncbi:MAG: DUF3531 family protein [Pseudanabaenaceae cyanobacterium]
MNVSFRECDWFNCWIWFRFVEPPTAEDRQYLEEILASWYLLGKLGGFNAVNLQVQEAGADISYLDYDNEAAAADMMSVMHNQGEVEYQDHWARCWFDLGTADALALDVLLNTLRQFSQDYTAIAEVVVGGQLDFWPLEPSHDD